MVLLPHGLQYGSCGLGPRVRRGRCCLLVQPRVPPADPRPWAKAGHEDARAEGRGLPSVRARCIVCYYSLSLKKSLTQEDGNIPNAWAELAETGVAVSTR